MRSEGGGVESRGEGVGGLDGARDRDEARACGRGERGSLA